MRRLCLLSLFILASASAGLAQGSDDYYKWDVYGGYSLGRFKTNVNSASFTSSSGTESFSNLCSSATGDMIGPNFQKFFCTRRNFNGFDASITRNLSKYVGIQGDLTGHFKSQTYVDKFTPPLYGSPTTDSRSVSAIQFHDRGSSNQLCDEGGRGLRYSRRQAHRRARYRGGLQSGICR